MDTAAVGHWQRPEPGGPTVGRRGVGRVPSAAARRRPWRWQSTGVANMGSLPVRTRMEQNAAMALLDSKRFTNWLEVRMHALSSTDADILVKVFRDYFRQVRGRLGIIAIMIAIISATTAGVALLVKDIVSVIFVDRDSVLFIYLVVGSVILFTARGLSTYYQTILSARISNQVIADAQRRLFAHVLKQQMSTFTKYSSDSLLMRFNQGASGFGSIFTTVLISGTRDAAQVVSLLAVMIYLDPLLTFLCLIVGPPVYYGVVMLLGKIKGLMEQELLGYSELNKRVRETVQGITVIKSFNLESTVRSSSGHVIDGLRHRMDRIAALQAAPLPLLEVAGGLGVSIAILYAGIRVYGGDYDPGTFVSFLTSMLLAADPARRLSQVRLGLKTSFEAIRMVYDLLEDDVPEQNGTNRLEDYRATLASGAAVRPPEIEFRNVSFSYAEQSPVLTDFSLQIAPGELVALVGPSGAGKSTVFKLLLKFYQPNAGRISIDGLDLAELETAALRDVIAYVGQSNFIFGGTIRDNLTLMDPSISQEQIEAACAQVGLETFISSLPQGYDTDVGELGALISGGQAQRLNLARALIKNSPVLLLDEITSALDAENEHKARQIIKEMAHSKTILVIAHRLSTVRDADRIILIGDGRIVGTGQHEELLENNSYYKRIVSLQLV
jgi:ATP-binding cassette subfamily B protein